VIKATDDGKSNKSMSLTPGIEAFKSGRFSYRVLVSSSSHRVLSPSYWN